MKTKLSKSQIILGLPSVPEIEFTPKITQINRNVTISWQYLYGVIDGMMRKQPRHLCRVETYVGTRILRGCVVQYLPSTLPKRAVRHQ